MMTDEIYQGVTVGGIPVGGLSVDAAEQKIRDHFQQYWDRPVILFTYNKQQWPITPQNFDLTIDAHNLALGAYDVGRNGNIIHRLLQRYLTLNQGYQISLPLSYNKDKLVHILTGIANSIDRPAQDARIKQSQNGTVINVISEVTGRKVDISKTVAAALGKLHSDLYASVPLIVQETTPQITAKDLANIDGVIASYTTQFDPSDNNRDQNIRLAAKRIHSVLLRPRQKFSFNTQVGLRSPQNGYKEAPVFIDGNLVPDWGGGVCQISSTLYNAVLLADLKILERTSHFHPPGYVPVGQDATVADHLIDFVFANNLPNNIYITNEVTDNQVTFYVLGHPKPNSPEIHVAATTKKVLEPNTVIKQDPNLELGKQIIESEGQKGFLVTTYRIKSLNGKEISREFLATDEFKPVDRIIRIGTKAIQKK
ncbi:VanW family protein [Lucifera butyrica]|nr:VanW family protein [Lucifera butyrica]